jgi:hypothetical protein
MKHIRKHRWIRCTVYIFGTIFSGMLNLREMGLAINMSHARLFENHWIKVSGYSGSHNLAVQIPRPSWQWKSALSAGTIGLVYAATAARDVMSDGGSQPWYVGVPAKFAGSQHARKSVDENDIGTFAALSMKLLWLYKAKRRWEHRVWKVKGIELCSCRRV